MNRQAKKDVLLPAEKSERKKPYTTHDVKKENRNRVFMYLYRGQGASRQSIVTDLGLSLPTVNMDVQSLMKEGLITTKGSFESTGGRRSQALIANADAAYTVSAIIGANTIEMELINLLGEMVADKTVKKRFSPTIEYRNFLEKSIEDFVFENKVKDKKYLGTGITLPAVFDATRENVVSAPTLKTKPFPVSVLTGDFKFKAEVMNDARSEAYAGFFVDDKKNQEHNDEVFLMIGTGVGGAYIRKDGVVADGHFNRFGEFGHMTIHPGGKTCNCGRKGCLEAYTNASVLSDDLGLTLDEFFASLDDGDEKNFRIFREYIKNLAIGINNIYTIFDQDVVIGGIVAPYLKKYEKAIRLEVASRYTFGEGPDFIRFLSCSPEQAKAGASLKYIREYLDEI